MKSTAIEFRNVSKKFYKAGYNAVDHVSLAIEEGEFITILGSSGCGKTTLLKIINRLYEPNIRKKRGKQK
jgi:osmoprotectant transport system ATP-binding protein